MFPVHNASDLRRAIRHAERSGDPADRKYVVSRARALGRMDVLPSGWAPQSTRSPSTARSLDDQFDAYADEYGVSAAKLKTVFFRGVREYEESDSDFGNATVWGMARVQRFLGGSCDPDLSACAVEPSVDPGVEITNDSATVVTSVLYGDVSALSRLFSPGRVTDVSLEDDELRVSGHLDGVSWGYTLNCVTGEQKLDFE